MTDVTAILNAIEAGNARTEELLPLVYEELRRLALAKMRHERPGPYVASHGAGLYVHQSATEAAQTNGEGVASLWIAADQKLHEVSCWHPEFGIGGQSERQRGGLDVTGRLKRDHLWALLVPFEIAG